MEMIGTAAGFIFTLLIFSYLLGDNFLYRLAVYVFVGLAAAFTTIVTLESVIMPLLTTGDDLSSFVNLILLAVGLVLTLFLLVRPLRPISIAFLVAVGASLSILGAISGTIFPFVFATGDTSSGIPNAIILFIGVATSLIYFQYHAQQRPDGTVRRSRLVEALASIGKGFIAVTLGALYATAILTSLTILAGRISFFIGVLTGGA